MPISKLSKDDQKRLAKEPETGMGFQVVFGSVGGKEGRFVVLASLLVLPAREAAELEEAFEELSEHGAGEIEEAPAQRAQVSGSLSVIEARLPDPRVVAARSQLAPQQATPPLVPKTALVVTRRSAVPEAFFRCSPRKKDPRVDPKTGDFARGTYAAPWSEIPLVPSGFAAVGRYALPNPFAARRIYPIVTDTTPQLVGAAAPAFGQAGGGVEVLFPKGARALHGEPHVIPAF